MIFLVLWELFENFDCISIAESYDAKLRDWRVQQQEMALKAVNATSGTSRFFSYKLDPRIVIQNSPVVGRHFVATESLPAHTVLLRERPYR